MLDSQIVALYLARDERAIAETQSKYGGYCTSIAQNILQNLQDAEECVNDTWLRTWNSIPPAQPTLLKTYVGKITRNLALDKYKSSHREKRGCGELAISFEDIPGGAKGYFSHAENRIAIQEGMSEIQTIKTAIHEIAHAKLHAIDPTEKLAPEERKDRHTKEVEAESVAYTVCQRYGIETSDYSFGYIAGWSSDKDTKELKGSLETIRSTAAEMIESIDSKLKVLLAEKDKEQINTQAWDKEIAVESEGKGFIEVHETDDGFDYTIYGSDMKLIDGGVIEDAETTAYKVAMALCEENGFEKPSIVFNYEAFQEQVAAANEVKPSFFEVPVYREMANYAYEAGELDTYRASRDANMACKEAIETAISDNFSNNHLSTEAAVTSVFDQFSPERVQYVLANTIQHKNHDGRIHQSLKDWAKEIEVCPDDTNSFIVDKVNPGLVSLFVTEVNRQVEEKAREAEQADAPTSVPPEKEAQKQQQSTKKKTQEEKPEKPSIRKQLKAAKDQTAKKAPAQKKSKTKEMEI